MKAILSDVYEDLEQVNSSHIVRSMTKHYFKTLFPSNYPPHSNVAWIDIREPNIFCCGRGLAGHGTGVIINAHENEENSKIWNIEGLTALHVIGKRSFSFKRFNYSGFTPYGVSSFTPGQSLHNYRELGSRLIINDKSYIHAIQIHPELDICIFHGTCKKSIGQMLEPNISIFDSDPSALAKKKACIIHYPNNAKKQRINYGILDDLDDTEPFLLYRINTLLGSSGSPVFYKDQLCGIHTSANALNPNKFVNFDGSRFGVTDLNKGVFVNSRLVRYLRDRPVVYLSK